MRTTYDLTVPASVGMRSFEKENKALRSALLLNAERYDEIGPLQQWALTPTGGSQCHAVYRYRFGCDLAALARIVEATTDKFGTDYDLIRVGAHHAA